jgi:hypothetical protein
MPIFAFYDYNISQRSDEEADLFKNQEEGDCESLRQYDSPEECFGSFFRSNGKLSLNVLKAKGKGKDKTFEWEPYENDVLMVADDVILMTIENNKWKHTTNKKKDVAHEHHPYCHVVIDNRPGHQVMAVVKNSAFDNKPDNVCGILHQAFNNKTILGKYHLKIEFIKRHREKNEFWPVVNDIRSIFKDSVRQIRMDFSGKDADEQPDPQDVVAVMRALAKKSASTAAVTLNAEGEEVRLDELHDDLTNMANICLNQEGYDLTVKFRTFGLYRYGADIVAQFGVEDEVIEEFEKGIKRMNYQNLNGSFALIEWLDRMIELLPKYNNETLVQKRGKRSRRR